MEQEMNRDFWLERWEKGEIGFHQDDINPHLLHYWRELSAAPDAKVFVPLCGKTRDMLWLRQQGHAVLGVELSAIAVDAFFRENGYAPERISGEHLQHCIADGIDIICGDFFDLTKDDLRGVTAVYDRASLVALPPDMRQRYAAHLMEILPATAQILLVTFDYPQPEMAGPPFAVSPDEVGALYSNRAHIRLLAHHDVLAQNPRFRERGLSRLQENIFLLRAKG